MKKFLFLQILLISFFLISFELSSYGSGNFTQLYNKGIEFYKQGKYDQAGKEFEKAIALKPNDVYALYGLGNTYYCKAKYDDAVKVYAKAININPDYAKVHYSLSLAYSKLGMTREAEKQKSIFRKLSKGGEGTSQKHSKSSQSVIDHTPKRTLSHAFSKKYGNSHATHEPSKHEDSHATHAPSKHEDSHATHEPSKHEDSHATHAPSKHEDSHATHAPSTHEDSHATHTPSKHEDSHATHEPSKHEDSHATHAPSTHEDSHATHAPSKHEDAHTTHAPKHDTGHGSGSDSHSIFKGYSDETHKADERVFKKKKHKKIAKGDSKSHLRSVKYFVQNKWYSSRIHKIWICAAGYILATQAWLCVVAFFCVIIWRIRERD